MNGKEERPEVDKYTYRPLFFDKCVNAIQWRKDSLFSKCCWSNWLSICKKLNFGLHLTLYTKINFKLINKLHN